MAFFQDGEEIANKVKTITDKLIKDVFMEILIVVCGVTLGLIILGFFRVRRLAYKMTASIINLYETLHEISGARKGMKGAVELSYKSTSKELNELHLTFNRVARTINLASKSMATKMTEEQQAQALLSYADAFHIYHEFDEHHRQKGVCLANIGSIMSQMGDYKTAMQYYAASIENMHINLPNENEFNEADSKK